MYDLRNFYENLSQEKKKVRDFIHSNPREAKNFFAMSKANEVISDQQYSDIMYDFDLWARPEQIEEIPDDKDTLLFMCGRGWGKSHYLSNKGINYCRKNDGVRVAVWAADYRSLKEINFRGDSGIIEMIPPDYKYDANLSDLIITFENGSKIIGYSAEAYQKSRGHQCHMSLLDELFFWSNAEEALEAARLITRLGTRPTMYIASSPYPVKTAFNLSKDPSVKVVKGSTMMNYFLPPTYAENLEKTLTNRRYRQEVLGELLEDNPNALFRIPDIDQHRRTEAPELRKIVVAVDPAATSNAESDATGIIVCGMGFDNRAYVLADETMYEATPNQWGLKVRELYRKWEADEIVAEKNQGGEMIDSVIRKGTVDIPPVRLVHASRGKEIRAEPISARYEHGEVSHVGFLKDLEIEMTEWNPTDKSQPSPNRVDALVWGLSRLFKGSKGIPESGYGAYKAEIDVDNCNYQMYGGSIVRTSKYGGYM